MRVPTHPKGLRTVAARRAEEIFAEVPDARGRYFAYGIARGLISTPRRKLVCRGSADVRIVEHSPQGTPLGNDGRVERIMVRTGAPWSGKSRGPRNFTGASCSKKGACVQGSCTHRSGRQTSLPHPFSLVAHLSGDCGRGISPLPSELQASCSRLPDSAHLCGRSHPRGDRRSGSVDAEGGMGAHRDTG